VARNGARLAVSSKLFSPSMELLLAAGGFNVYLILAALLLAGAFGLPIPEDLPLIYSGKLLADGFISPIPTFLVCYVAILIGDSLLFFIGYWGGSKVLESRRFRRRFNPRRIKKLENGLKRHSFKLVFLGRHLFYLRSLTFIMCGSLKLSYLRFLLFDSLAAIISVTLMLSLGYYSANFIDLLITTLAEFRNLLLVGLVLIVVFYLAKKWKIKSLLMKLQGTIRK
jgi:membrane protein DedA with SNARE-associated domain